MLNDLESTGIPKRFLVRMLDGYDFGKTRAVMTPAKKVFNGAIGPFCSQLNAPVRQVADPSTKLQSGGPALSGLSIPHALHTPIYVEMDSLVVYRIIPIDRGSRSTI